MFILVLILCLLPLMMALYPLGQGGSVDAGMLLVALPGGLGVGRVIAEWISNPNGVKDFTQGGVVGFKETPYHLRWYDWAIFMTRRGTIEKATRTLRLERRLFFGLIPLGSVQRSLDDFYRVAVEREDVKRTRGEGSRRYQDVVRVDYAVQLVDRKADGLTVLDLSTSANSNDGSQFVGTFRTILEEVVVGDRQRRLRVRRPLDEEPAGGDDFEAWRAKREEE